VQEKIITSSPFVSCIGAADTRGREGAKNNDRQGTVRLPNRFLLSHRPSPFLTGSMAFSPAHALSPVPEGMREHQRRSPADLAFQWFKAK
jgi:hypothetical protein